VIGIFVSAHPSNFEPVVEPHRFVHPFKTTVQELKRQRFEDFYRDHIERFFIGQHA